MKGRAEENKNNMGYLIEPEMVQNLKDAGCNEGLIDSFLSCWEKKNVRKGLQILAGHRAALLQDVRAGQKKIDCLDYLIYHIRKSAQ